MKTLNAFSGELCFGVLQIYLLLEFFSEFDNSFCKILGKRLSKTLGYGILIFYRKPKWRHLEVCICTFFLYANFQVTPF